MLPRTLFDAEHDLFRDAVRKWAEAEVFPHGESWRRQGAVSAEIWRKAGAQGYLCPFADESHGGLGLDDIRYDMILTEEINPREPGFFIALHNRIVGPYLQKFATPEQQGRFLPGVVSGDTVLAIAMTEPGTGSDLAAIRTKAEDKGDHWLLNGSKTYISNGLLAGLIVVAARTGPGHQIGLFLVDGGTAGLRRGAPLQKLGLKSQDTAELFFDDVKVPKQNVLGDPLGGFKMMMQNLAEERLIGAAGFVARSHRALAITLDYVQERQAFGQSIGSFQNSRFVLAGLQTETDAAQALTDQCAAAHLQGGLTAELAAEAKLFASEVEARVVDQCLQLFGGAGYMEEYEISRLYADARVSRIYAGSSEIMREIISRGMGLDPRGR